MSIFFLLTSYLLQNVRKPLQRESLCGCNPNKAVTINHFLQNVAPRSYGTRFRTFLFFAMNRHQYGGSRDVKNTLVLLIIMQLREDRLWK